MDYLGPWTTLDLGPWTNLDLGLFLTLPHRVVVLDPVDLSSCNALKQGFQIIGILDEVNLRRVYDQQRSLFVMVKKMFVGFNQLIDIGLRYFGLKIEVAERNPLQQDRPWCLKIHNQVGLPEITAKGSEVSVI